MSVRVASRFGLVALSMLAMAACSPKPPTCSEPISPAVVDGATATERQMSDAHDAVVRFQKQSDDYQTCLVTAIEDHRRNPPFFSRFYDDGLESATEARKHQNQLQKQKVVGDFNTAVRTFNSLHP